jgi:hypothetical protein
MDTDKTSTKLTSSKARLKRRLILKHKKRRKLLQQQKRNINATIRPILKSGLPRSNSAINNTPLGDITSFIVNQTNSSYNVASTSNSHNQFCKQHVMQTRHLQAQQFQVNLSHKFDAVSCNFNGQHSQTKFLNNFPHSSANIQPNLSQSNQNTLSDSTHTPINTSKTNPSTTFPNFPIISPNYSALLKPNLKPTNQSSPSSSTHTPNKTSKRKPETIYVDREISDNSDIEDITEDDDFDSCEENYVSNSDSENDDIDIDTTLPFRQPLQGAYTLLMFSNYSCIGYLKILI